MNDDYVFLTSLLSIQSVNDFLSMNASFYNVYPNGRVASNNLAILFVSDRILSALVRSVMVIGIVWLVSKILNIKSTFGRLSVAVLIFFVPLNIFSQTIAWRAGFSVYIPPVLAVFALWWLVSKYISDSKPRSASLFFIGLVGYMGALFVENITIALSISAVVLLLVGLYMKNRRIIKSSIALTIGSGLGATTMFMSPTYLNLLQRGGGYRSYSGGDNILYSIFENLMKSISLFWADSGLILVAIFILAIILIIVSNKYIKIKDKTKIGLLAVISSAALYISTLDNIIQISNQYSLSQKIAGIVGIVAIVSMYLAFVSLVWLVVKNKKIKIFSISFIAMSFLILLPLLKVSSESISPRVFYPVYVFQTIALFSIGVYLFKEYEYKIKNAIDLEVIKRSIYVTFIGTVSVTLLIFSAISVRELQNSVSAERQVRSGKTTIELRKFPFEKFIIYNYKNSQWLKAYYPKCKCKYWECNPPCGYFEIIYR